MDSVYNENHLLKLSSEKTFYALILSKILRAFF